MPISLKLLALGRAVPDFCVLKPRKTKRYIPFLRLRVSAPLLLRITLSPPDNTEKRGYFIGFCRRTKYIERNSVGIRVRAVIKSPNDLEIHIRVSLTFRTVGIHHRFKEMISRFSSFVPLPNFSITNCYYAVL